MGTTNGEEKLKKNNCVFMRISFGMDDDVIQEVDMILHIIT